MFGFVVCVCPGWCEFRFSVLRLFFAIDRFIVSDMFFVVFIVCDSVCFLFGFVILSFFVFGGSDGRSFQLKVCFHLLRGMQERFSVYGPCFILPRLCVVIFAFELLKVHKSLVLLILRNR